MDYQQEAIQPAFLLPDYAILGPGQTSEVVKEVAISSKEENTGKAAIHERATSCKSKQKDICLPVLRDVDLMVANSSQNNPDNTHH